MAEFSGFVASAVERGMPVEAGLDLMASHAGSSRRRTVMQTVARSVREGRSLPEALSGDARAFPEDYRSLVSAGQESGRLGEVLRSCEEFYRLRDRMKARFLRLALYLGLVALVGVVAVSLPFLLGGGIMHESDKFFEMIKAMRSDPDPVRLLGLTGSGVLLVGLFLSSILFLAWITRWRVGYWVPLWGRLLKARDLSLFCATVEMKISAGRPLPEAVASANRSIRNRYARRSVERVRSRLEEGWTLSDCLIQERYFPKTLTWAVSLGAARGDLRGVFESFTRLYRAEAERCFEAVYLVLNPLGMVLVGSVVLVSALSVIWPIADLISILEGITSRG